MDKTQTEERKDLLCTGCGLIRIQWADDRGAGFHKDGSLYCCRGCASGSGCTCL